MGYAFRGILNIIWKFGQTFKVLFFNCVLVFLFLLNLRTEVEKHLYLLHILCSWEFVFLDNSDHNYYVIYRGTILGNFIAATLFSILFWTVLQNLSCGTCTL